MNLICKPKNKDQIKTIILPVITRLLLSFFRIAAALEQQTTVEDQTQSG